MNNNIENINKNIVSCNKCDLSIGRKNVVVGDGIFNAPIMLIGEAPGAKEEETGVPFVGRSGQLLMKMLGDIGVFRDKNLYITNTVKCRPPENRNPKSMEIKLCKHFLDEQIAAHNPKVIILVGNFATKYFLGKDIGITKVHGKIFESENRILFPVFHPAALLRNPKLKPISVQDFEYLREILLSQNII